MHGPSLLPCGEAAIRATPCAAPCVARMRPWVLATTILASSMVFVDGTVANVALPALQETLGASARQAQWVIEAYALMLAALLLAGGAAGDRFGRRKVFALGTLVFTLASLACGLAGSINQLIAARAVQGVGGALLVPGSLAIISASFDEEGRGKAIGTWSAYTSLTAAIGPVLGGFLIDHLSWRAAFLINIPLGIAVLLLTWRCIPESHAPGRDSRFDWAGALLASLALGSLVFFLTDGPERGWRSAPVLAAVTLAVVAGSLFAVVERGHPAPLLRFSLFRSRDFSGANLLTLLLYAGLGGGLYFLPLNLIQAQRYTPTEAGATLLPFVAIMFLLSRWSGGVADRYGARLPLVIGPLVAAAGFALFALPGLGGSYWSTYFPAVIVLGLGMAITVAPLTTTVMNAHGERLAGMASGINNAVSRVGAVLAIAVLGLVMGAGFGRALDARIEGLELAAPLEQAVLAQRDRMGAIVAPTDAPPAVRNAVEQAVAASMVSGFRQVMLVSAGMAVAGALFAWIMIAPRRMSGKLNRASRPHELTEKVSTNSQG
ncbi:MFS transporter [Noviherbaspirillum saxi]|uniref:DHA2 family efflux MFS transporter permease subunit n=1 Tax=Noviherbaspirillum saxi TaxID=2320863 RepID=A0A3A3FKI3_9BURK|nr:MFS transporter [Noviherbaspirillum saxi]RJF95704.1 DHA2 family efflux MFS transporter permease subunit [Noviherbaspirillum saxi]